MDLAVWGLAFADLNLATSRVVFLDPQLERLRVAPLPTQSGAPILGGLGAWEADNVGAEVWTEIGRGFWHELLESLVFNNVGAPGNASGLRKPALRLFVESFAVNVRSLRPTTTELTALRYRQGSIVAILTLLKRAGVKLLPVGEKYALREDGLSVVAEQVDAVMEQSRQLPARMAVNIFERWIARERAVDSNISKVVIQLPALTADGINPCIAGMVTGEGAAFDGHDRSQARKEMSLATGIIDETQVWSNISCGYKHAEYWGLRRNGCWVGFVGLTLWPLEKNKLWIGYLNVAKQLYQHAGNDCGYGKLLLGLAMRRAKQRGFDSVSVWTTEDNVVARNVYVRCGFAQVDGLPPDSLFNKYEPEVYSRPICYRKSVVDVAVEWPVASE